jgi:hypothetical protein
MQAFLIEAPGSVPAGRPDISPAIYCRVKFRIAQVPKGRLNKGPVSVSQLDKIVQYIRGQPEHHRKMTFQEEFLELLKKHGVEYDERYLCD